MRGDGTVYHRGNRWWISYYANGKRQRGCPLNAGRRAAYHSDAVPCASSANFGILP